MPYNIAMKYKTHNTTLMTCLISCLVLLTINFTEHKVQAESRWAGTRKTTWKGHARFDFKVDSKSCYVVEPKSPAKGNPWIWRARFPGYHAEIDLELLKHGYHIAHMNTGGMLGSPAALDHWDKFYDYITKAGLSKRPALEGVSRGGLFVYRWASRHPDRVACIYADTPVCDFKSWPLGQGKGIGSQTTWLKLLQQYRLNKEQALAYKGNPVDVEILKPIAAKKVPLLHIVSETDTVVPPTENTYVLQQRYKTLGGPMTVISVKAGSKKSHGHHFTLTKEHIRTAVEFITINTVTLRSNAASKQAAP
jgi:hypothetical protein